MKLAISAVLLSVVLAAPLAGQAAPNSGSDDPPRSAGMHPGGPHGRGMFGPGMAAHRVESIANSPFSAQFTETWNSANGQGNTAQRSSTSTIYRDSQGRVREETTLPPHPPRAPQSADAAATPAA
ncbi:MAG: hypothetical protein INR71_07615, partial [Terriglobus roseus]|nr:hypothetical protein [Terriglobus roseus]